MDDIKTFLLHTLENLSAMVSFWAQINIGREREREKKLIYDKSFRENCLKSGEEVEDS